MKTARLLPILAALLSACGAAPNDASTAASDEPLTVTEVHLSKSGPPQIDVMAETRAERALRIGAADGTGRGVHSDAIVSLGGGQGGRGASPCSSYAQTVLLELCDDSSPGCSTGNLACIYGTPQDAMIPLTSVPRGWVTLGHLGSFSQGNFYQHVVQYRPNQLGAVFENARTSFPYYVYCSETSIDDPWWIRAGACAASQANLIGINCLGAGSQLPCTYHSDCCGVGAWCNGGTCTGGTY
jgi:hypothetical protein